MIDLIRFSLLSLGAGAMYALLAHSAVVVYRGSGIINFASGALATLGAMLFSEFGERGWSTLPAMAAAVAFVILVGVAFQLLVMERLRRAAPISRVAATLGLLIVVEAGLVLRYGAAPLGVPSVLPKGAVTFSGDISVGKDRLWLLVIAFVATLLLHLLYKRTRFGLATSAAAENEMVAGALGWSPKYIGGLNWALGSGIAAVAGILLAPITGLQVGVFTIVLLAALAAALIGQFTSFPATLLGGLGIALLETHLTRYVSTPGVARSVPFAVIIVILVVSGKSLPLRSFFLEKLPAVGTGRIRPIPLVVTCGALVVLLWTWFPTNWVDAVTTSATMAVVLLSVVILTGYAGQLSLAQYAIAGVGAFVSGRLVASRDWPLEAAAPAALLVAATAGVLISLPAFRTRGSQLAIATLGIGLALQLIVFNSYSLTGGSGPTVVEGTTLFGIDIDAVNHPERYATLVVLSVLAVGLMTANLRRSRVGRTLLAVRENERAAATLGVNVIATKAYAFGLAGAVAALAGILIAFRNRSVEYTQFSVFASITAVANTVIGGVGYIGGALVGSTLALGGIGSLIEPLLHSIDKFLPLIGGALLIITLLQDPDGLVPFNVKAVQHTWSKLRKRSHGSTPPAAASPTPSVPRTAEPSRPTHMPPHRGVGVAAPVAPRTLRVEHLSVHFGGVRAVNDVSFEVRPGEVVGLIGPNGAGKTTIIDAISGLVKAQAGLVEVDGDDIGRWSPARRAHAGVARSFQSLELFDDMTVEENLRVASDRARPLHYLTDLVVPRRPPLQTAATAAVDVFGLGGLLEQRPGSLPYGFRRLIGIARAVAGGPSILLLDEPASGLSAQEATELGVLVREMADSWGVAILLVEHDVELVMSICDRVVVLDFGNKIAEGDPHTVRRDPAVIAAYLGPSETADDAEPELTSSREPEVGVPLAVGGHEGAEIVHKGQVLR